MNLWRFATAVAVLLFCSSPALAAWHEARSQHFIIYANLDPDELSAFATRLERFDRAVRVVRGMSDPPLSDSNRLTVYVLENANAVGRLSGSSSVLGFYIPRAAGSVAFVPRPERSRPNRRDAHRKISGETVFFHEYAHHLMLQELDQAYPAWLVEGFAEFFATAVIEEDGSVGFGAVPQHRAQGLFNLKSLSLEEMVGGTYSQLSGEEREKLYGRGWLLTHYLAFEPSRRGQLTKYVGGIQKGQSALVSARSAFGDLRQLSSELDRYMGRNRFDRSDVPADKIAVAPIQVRRLRPGEAAVMGARIQSERGVDSRNAPSVAELARRAAGHYPADPFAQTALAEAEHDAKNLAAAEAAADRAIAADPAYARALIYKGRARMEQAKLNPAKADWKDIRGWLAKANKIDPDDPEPLMLFYQTYGAEGTNPTRNAIEGLLYAHSLVPQDAELRMLVVRQMLVDGNIAAARRAMIPIAFNPHLGRGREDVLKVMAAIDAGDAKGALKLLDDAQTRAEEEARKRG